MNARVRLQGREWGGREVVILTAVRVCGDGWYENGNESSRLGTSDIGAKTPPGVDVTGGVHSSAPQSSAAVPRQLHDGDRQRVVSSGARWRHRRQWRAVLPPPEASRERTTVLGDVPSLERRQTGGGDQ